MALELGLHGHRLESQTLIIIFTGQTEQSCRHRQGVSDALPDRRTRCSFNGYS